MPPRHQATLSTRLQLWNSSAGGLEVVAASSGKNAPGCESPRLVVLLYGHFRTMQATAKPLREMAEASSGGGCHLVAAVLPEAVNINYSHFYAAQRAAAATTTRQARAAPFASRDTPIWTPPKVLHRDAAGGLRRA